MNVALAMQLALNPWGKLNVFALNSFARVAYMLIVIILSTDCIYVDSRKKFMSKKNNNT